MDVLRIDKKPELRKFVLIEDEKFFYVVPATEDDFETRDEVSRSAVAALVIRKSDDTITKSRYF